MSAHRAVVLLVAAVFVQLAAAVESRATVLLAAAAVAQFAAAVESPGSSHLTWNRGSTKKDDVQLEKAARLHQDGDLDQAVSILKAVVKSSPQHAEAHASLSKLLFDQGKTSLAEKAMAKATKLNNDKAAQWELF